MPDLIITMEDAVAAGGPATPGQLTRAQLLENAKDFLGRSGTSDDTLMVRLLNQVQQEIARLHKWSCLRVVETGTTTADEDTYSWPGGLNELIDFRLTGDNRRVLHKLEVPHAGKLYPDPDTSPAAGVPSYYIDLGAQYRLVPTPDDAYPWWRHIEKWPADLDADDDTSDLLNMGDLLTHMLCMHMALRLGLRDDWEVYQRAVYSEYPLGSKVKRGLLQQAIIADKRRMPARAIKRPFRPEDEDEDASLSYQSYLANPRVGLR